MDWSPYNITFEEQKVTICDRGIELFRQEHNDRPDGALVRRLRSEFDVIMPSAYHAYRMIWLNVKWADVLNGKPEYGFPGVPLDVRVEATEKKNELIPILKRFYKWQRDEYNVTIKRLFKERHIAEIASANDNHHGNPHIDEFIANGLPSKNPNANSSTNAAYLRRLIKLNPNMTEAQREAVDNARGATKKQSQTDTYWGDGKSPTSKIKLDDVRRTRSTPEPPDPLQDWTGVDWTEVDAGGTLTVAANTLTTTDLLRDTDQYIWKDLGSIKIWEHIFDFKITAMVNNARSAPYYIADTVNERQTAVGGSGIFTSALITSTGIHRTQFLTRASGVTEVNDIDDSTFVIGTQYYQKPSRDNLVVGLDWATDVDFTTIVIALGGTMTTDITTQYLHMAGSHNTGNASFPHSSIISNLDFQVAVAFQPSLLLTGMG